MPWDIRSMRRGTAGSPGAVTRHIVGNALVLHVQEQISPEAQSLALAVVEDTENDVVVLDLGDGMPVASWESMAGMVPRRRKGIRLIACGRHRNAAAMTGQWLSERLSRTVIAPDGDLIRGSAGGLFVHSTPGSGWVRFRPGKPPTWDSKRYPTPLWDTAATENRATSSVGEIEPLPGGVWIHDTRAPEIVAAHRERLIGDLPCHPETMTVVLGCPGTAPLPLDDVVRFWRELDPESRARARFVQYGDVQLPEHEAFGQTLADLLSTRVICYTGVPVGGPQRYEVRTVRFDGSLGWPPFARQLGYLPRAHPNSKAQRPEVVDYRPPLDWTEEIASRVYWYAPDAVVEVVQAGLWVRSTDEPANGERVRAAVLDPEGTTLIFDDTVAARSTRMQELAADLAALLDDPAGAGSALLPASVLVPGRKPAGRAHAVLDFDEIKAVTAGPGRDAGQVTLPDPVIVDAVALAAVVAAGVAVPAEGPLPVEASAEQAQIPAASGRAQVSAFQPAAQPHPSADIAPMALPESAPGRPSAEFWRNWEVPAQTGSPSSGPRPAPTSARPETDDSTTARLNAVGLDPGNSTRFEIRRPPVTAPRRPPEPATAADPVPAEPAMPSRVVDSAPPLVDSGVPAPAPVVPEPFQVAGMVEPVQPVEIAGMVEPVALPEVTVAGPEAAPAGEPQQRQPIKDDRSEDTPVAREPAQTADVPAPAGSAPEPAPVEQVRIQPVPASGATALLPNRALDDERSWMRRTLSREFDSLASSVSRIMSEHPSMQNAGLRSEDTLVDAVAVRLYLTRRGEGVDTGLRSGRKGSHVPFARCAVSGLSRLASFRGATLFRASPSEQEWALYRGRKLVTDWGFVNVLTRPYEAQDGDTDVLIWSMTGRRTALLEPEGTPRIDDRVLFLPGTNFKILELREPADGGRGAIFLREIGSNEIDATGRVDPNRFSLDELATTSLGRSLDRWAQMRPAKRIDIDALARFDTLPGLERKG